MICMIATCPIKTNNQKAKLGKKEARSTREREGDMAGERERGGGAPEKEGGAARGSASSGFSSAKFPCTAVMSLISDSVLSQVYGVMRYSFSFFRWCWG
ncbi:hypothetical protein P8452_43395 [Trifolium repens]|nr:hypothetical protein P8452_43395 [Trifolium repens]